MRSLCFYLFLHLFLLFFDCPPLRWDPLSSCNVGTNKIFVVTIPLFQLNFQTIRNLDVIVLTCLCTQVILLTILRRIQLHFKKYLENCFILSDSPIGTEHCGWLYGIFGHETSCTRYWTCWNGTATEQLCIGGLLYNERTHSCDWPENVDGCQKHRKYTYVDYDYN